MNIAEKIYREVSRLPENLAREVLDFAEYIAKKHGHLNEIQNLKEAQAPAMEHIWNNEADEVWNDHPTC